MNYNKNNYFKSNKHINKKPEFFFNPNEYPEVNLIRTDQKQKEINNECLKSNFASAILKPIETKSDKDLLKPGWISITNVNNNLIYKYGTQINNDISNNNENDINLIMYNISKKIKENREKYKRQYNEINGLYAFEDFYQNHSIYDTILNNYNEDPNSYENDDINEYENEEINDNEYE